jgi:hypothetical protein
VHNWTLVSDQFNYTGRTSGWSDDRRENQGRGYRHPVNGIGINGWSHPWGKETNVPGFEVAEVMVFDKILTQAQLRSIERNTCKSKYGFMKA